MTRHEQILRHATQSLRKATTTLDGVTNAATAKAAGEALPTDFVNRVELHQLGAPDPQAKEHIKAKYKEFESAASDFGKSFKSLEARMAQQGTPFKDSQLHAAVMLTLMSTLDVKVKFDPLAK